ncbi:hypothetical protein RRG08_002879, partial [Elysia crispata]
APQVPRWPSSQSCFLKDVENLLAIAAVVFCARDQGSWFLAVSEPGSPHRIGQSHYHLNSGLPGMPSGQIHKNLAKEAQSLAAESAREVRFLYSSFLFCVYKSGTICSLYCLIVIAIISSLIKALSS